MMVAAPRLSESLQALVDLRLDTIDRMLLDRVPRQDRVNIVGEVEAQIFELLEQRGVEAPGRDDVLAVLSRIDPPEAYVPEGSERRVATATGRVVTTLSSDRPQPEAGSSLGRTSGILGLASLFGAPVAVVITYIVGFALMPDDVAEPVIIFGLFGTAFLAFLGGLFAVVLATYVRLRGVWAVIGLIAGGMSMVMSTLGALFVMMSI